jgi:hypothetical protein
MITEILLIPTLRHQVTAEDRVFMNGSDHLDLSLDQIRDRIHAAQIRMLQLRREYKENPTAQLYREFMRASLRCEFYAILHNMMWHEVNGLLIL